MKSQNVFAIALLLAGSSAAYSAEPAGGGPAWANLKTGVRHRVLAADSSTKKIAIFDADGKVEWEHPIAEVQDLHMLPNGNILLQKGWTEVIELTREGKTVWSYDAAKMNGNEGKPVQVHAFQRLPGGVTMIAESGPGRIIEVDPTGRIAHEIKLKLDHPDPHRDTRLARKIANGHYLVCHEGDGHVREYDADGVVVWDYAIPGEGHGFEHKGSGTAVFGAIRLLGDNTLIATGNGHSVIEVTPEKKIVWSLTSKDLPGIELAWVTTLELLPNGNIVIGNCHAGPDNPQIIEVTRDKKLLWAFRDFKTMGDSLSNSQLLDIKGDVVR